MKILIITFLFLTLLIGCKSQSSSTDPNSSKTELESYNYKSCNLSELSLSQSLGGPETIIDVVDLINALPKPLTIPCFMQSLNRPLNIKATKSTLSAQPAHGEGNARLFIFSKDLVISILLDGRVSTLMEFGEFVSDTKSIKGELKFPIEKNIDYAEPFRQINLTSTRTRCSGCHGSDTLSSSTLGINIFESNAFKPLSDDDLSLYKLINDNRTCYKGEIDYKCKMYLSTFLNGSVDDTQFPIEVPFFVDPN